MYRDRRREQPDESAVEARQTRGTGFVSTQHRPGDRRRTVGPVPKSSMANPQPSAARPRANSVPALMSVMRAVSVISIERPRRDDLAIAAHHEQKHLFCRVTAAERHNAFRWG